MDLGAFTPEGAANKKKKEQIISLLLMLVKTAVIESFALLG